MPTAGRRVIICEDSGRSERSVQAVFRQRLSSTDVFDVGSFDQDVMDFNCQPCLL